MYYHDDADTVAIIKTISSPAIASLLSVHPNDVTNNGQQLPSEWSSWWSWASGDTPGRPAWLQLMRYFARSSDDDGPSDIVRDALHHRITNNSIRQIPPELCRLIDSVRSLQLGRAPSEYEPHGSVDNDSHGLSPKKQHEVDRMSSFIHQLVHSESPRSVWHAVDVGSGQGYLSRALQQMSFHVLALDNNENQTSGANRWSTREAANKLRGGRHTNLESAGKLTRKSSSHSRVEPTEQDNAGRTRYTGSPGLVHLREGSLTHWTVHVSPRSLGESIDDWLVSPPACNDPQSPARGPVPVMLVALHACGSLTVDVLRAFVSDQAQAPQGGVECVWRPHSLVVVGCCYNLMSPSDFPLSKPLRDLNPVPKLPIAALHLAAQVPSEWLRSESTLKAAELALRKVVYRALLQPILQAVAVTLNSGDPAALSQRPIQPGLGETVANRRLGKLNNQAYQDWPTFLQRATNKLGIELAAMSAILPEWLTHEATRLKMENALFVLQTLRCVLGPLIETLILVDRRNWIRQELAEMNDRGREVEVEMINLFDQATGSGRNVALVIKPATIPH